jgi:hypothetical protein
LLCRVPDMPHKRTATGKGDVARHTGLAEGADPFRRRNTKARIVNACNSPDRNQGGRILRKQRS